MDLLDDSPDLRSLVKESQTTLSLVARVAGGKVCVRDASDEIIWESYTENGKETPVALLHFRIEAEPVGTVSARCVGADDVTQLVAAILDSAYKRKLLVRMYQEALSDSYEGLLARNRELTELATSLEERVREQTRELDEAHVHLAREEKVAAIGRLAAGVAHELNTPLACLACNLEALTQMPPNDEETDVILSECVEMVDRASRIVRDLQGFSHVDDLGRVEVDLNEEINLILGRLEVPSTVQIETDYGELLPVLADGQRLTVALLHVLENARDAVAEDGGKIRVVTEVDDNLALVLIHDSGPGIPPDIMGRLFDPFFTTKDVGQGAGLGLTVARDIMRAHGGNLTLECPPSGGTIARFSLPVLNRRAHLELGKSVLG